MTSCIRSLPDAGSALYKSRIRQSPFRRPHILRSHLKLKTLKKLLWQKTFPRAESSCRYACLMNKKENDQKRFLHLRAQIDLCSCPVRCSFEFFQPIIYKLDRMYSYLIYKLCSTVYIINKVLVTRTGMAAAPVLNKGKTRS